MQGFFQWFNVRKKKKQEMKDSGGSESATHSQLTGMRTQVQPKESNLEDEKSMEGG